MFHFFARDWNSIRSQVFWVLLQITTMTCAIITEVSHSLFLILLFPYLLHIFHTMVYRARYVDSFDFGSIDG